MRPLTKLQWGALGCLASDTGEFVGARANVLTRGEVDGRAAGELVRRGYATSRWIGTRSVYRITEAGTLAAEGAKRQAARKD